jgi:hypothetical protein
MFKAEKTVPQIYYDNSYDFRIYTKMLEIIYNGADYNIKELCKMRNPKTCRDTFLIYLKHMYQTSFPNWLSTDQLRTLLYSYKDLMLYKGTESGFKYATRIALGTNASYTIQIEDNIISLNIKTEIYDKKFLYFVLNLVRPVGFIIGSVDITSQQDYSATVNLYAQQNIVTFNDNKMLYASGVYDKNKKLVSTSHTTGQYIQHVELKNNDKEESNNE